MAHNTLSDQDLVKRYMDGEHRCIEVLIDRHKSKVYTYILLTVRNPVLAEDLFQDTFIKVIQSLKRGKYVENGRFISWVVRIAHNLTIDHFRKENQISTLSNDDYESDIFNQSRFSDKTIEDALVEDQIFHEVKQLIDYLPEEQKEVVMLRHYGGLSFKEIAEQTEVSINTALGRMRYALINMRKMIKEKNIHLTIQ